MKKDEIDQIKNKHQWAFNWPRFFQRYFILFVPISIIIISCSMLYGGYKYGHIYKNHFMNSFFFTAICMFLIGVFFTYYIVNRIERERRFKILEIPNHISFIDITDKLRNLNWTITTDKIELIQYSTNISLFSWGECVTIVKLNDHTILVNTQAAGRQPFTFNRDQVNFRKIKMLLV